MWWKSSTTRLRALDTQEKRRTSACGYGQGWAVVPATCQKCWVAAERPQSSRCMLVIKIDGVREIDREKEREGVVSKEPKAAKTCLIIICGLQGALSCCGSVCWLRMAATRLFPGRAIRDTPRLRETSEAWTNKSSERVSKGILLSIRIAAGTGTGTGPPHCR